MRSLRIIPCLDVDAGRVVKGVQFKDLVDAGDPVALAANYETEGADEIVFLDITASADKRDTLVETVERTADVLFIPLTVGGGVRKVDDARLLLRSGADKVGINTAAVLRPQLINEIAFEFGNQCVVVAVDVKGGQVFTNGGRVATGLDVETWIREAVERGAGEILLTSMDRDGTKDGYDLALLKSITNLVDVPVVASGGVGAIDHLIQGADAGADALLAASIFHFGDHSIAEAKDALTAAGYNVRPVEPPQGEMYGAV